MDWNHPLLNVIEALNEADVEEITRAMGPCSIGVDVIDRLLEAREILRSVSYHYIDLDMIVSLATTSDGSLIVADGPEKTDMDACGVRETKVLEEYGPAGGNPLIKLIGPKDCLVHYLREVYCKDLPESELEMHLGRIGVL